ncbi:MAG TPA: T9SS type A sorting domain-containing protein, partial [Candidatus Cloacimonadota bacterium]|nr:T9SS type A sorting domain-containing protein [Candidatus Cloacimonadota bacterium]
DKSYNYIGLFGFIENAVIKNIKVFGANVTGMDFTGLLIGYSTASQIQNCFVKGSIRGNEVVGGLCGKAWLSTIIDCYSSININSLAYSGGLLGASSASEINHSFSSGIITNPYFTGGFISHTKRTLINQCGSNVQINVQKNRAGGFIACNTDSSTILNSYSNGLIYANYNSLSPIDHNYSIAGGFVSLNTGGSKIQNCYTMSNLLVHASISGGFASVNNAGSLIENCYSNSSIVYDSVDRDVDIVAAYCANNSATIKHCLSLSKINYLETTALDNMGFVATQNDSAVYVHNYFDIQKTNQIHGIGAEGKSSEELQIASTYQDWDFENTWQLSHYLNEGYVSLKWQTYNPEVQISQFRGEYSNQTPPILQWDNQLEYNVSAYLVYRTAENEFSDAILVNTQPVYAFNDFESHHYMITDNNNNANLQDYYWLKICRPYGTDIVYGPIRLTQTLTNEENTPLAHLNLSNYPNPFNPQTSISFNLDYPSHVKLDIYNTKGQKVNTLLNNKLNKGQHKIVWDGKDFAGKRCASGVYFCQFSSGEKKFRRKMLMMK